MSFKNIKQGWFKLTNPSKFIPPIDTFMGSFNESSGEVNYKSGLELKGFRYADYNKFIKRWSIESFPIMYRKPTDNKVHRYYIDMYLQFSTGEKFLVEIKPSQETKPPKKPKKMTTKSANRYTRQMMTYEVNSAKWEAAKQFGAANNMKFIILTEKELN